MQDSNVFICSFEMKWQKFTKIYPFTSLKKKNSKNLTSKVPILLGKKTSSLKKMAEIY